MEALPHFAAPQPLTPSSTNASTLVLSQENYYSQLIQIQGGLFNNLCEEGMANPLTVNDAFDSQFNAQQKALDLLNDPIFQQQPTQTNTTSSSSATHVVDPSTSKTSSSLESSSWMEQNASLDDLLFGGEVDEELAEADIDIDIDINEKEKLETICSSPSSSRSSCTPPPTSNSNFSKAVSPSGPKKRGRKPLLDANGQPCAKKQRGTPAKPVDNNPEELEKYLKLRMSNNISAVKSRQKRKAKEVENSERLKELEKENTELRAQLEAGRNECQRLAKLLEQAISKINEKQN